MRSRTPLAFLIAILLLIAAPHRPFAMDAPVNDPVNTLLERWEILGYFDHLLSASKPYSRLFVAARLLEARNHQAEMTAVDRDALKYQLFSYKEEVERLDPQVDISYRSAWDPVSTWPLLRDLNIFRNHKDLYSLQTDDWTVLLNASFRYRRNRDQVSTVRGESGNSSVISTGYQLRAYWEQLSISAAARDSGVKGTPDVISNTEFPYRRYGNNPSPNQFDFYDTWSSLEYENKHVTLNFGKAVNVWGHGESGSMSFSRQVLPYSQIRLQGRIGPFELTSLQGKLQQDPPVDLWADSLYTNVLRHHYAEKWVAAHRVQITFGHAFQLGMFEQVYYGERGLDLDYLAPLTFYRGIEHYGRDQDNVMLGVDFRALYLKRFSTYGEILFDDLNVSNITSDERSHNKFGFLLGTRAIDPIPGSNTRLTVEYALLTPYLYTHKYPINVPQQYGVNMGYPLQPNSDQWYLSLEWTPTRPLVLTGRFVHMRHGGNTEDGVNVGGTVQTPMEHNGETNVAFLSGDPYRETRIEFEAEFEVLYDLILSARVSYQDLSLDQSVSGMIEKTGTNIMVGIVYHPLP